MKLVDFKYRDEFSFWEYKYYREYTNREILPPTNNTIIKEVKLTDTGEYNIGEFLTFKKQSFIVMVASPMKELIWDINGSSYRSRCFSFVEIEKDSEVILRKFSNTTELFYIIQGDLSELEYTELRAFYKRWRPESEIIDLMNKPVPKYIKDYDGYHSVIDNDSDTTIVNCVDAGWWLAEWSFTPWYSPYMLTWKKAGINVLNWRTPITKPFSFGFDISVEETVSRHRELINKHFPKTKRVIYFGQCLGVPKTIITACKFGADDLYTTSTFFNPLLHRSRHLMQISGYQSQDAIEALSNTVQLPRTTFLYKAGDSEEKQAYSSFLYHIGQREKVKHYMVSYLDVWSPVLSHNEYGFYSKMGIGMPNTTVDLEFNEDPKLRKKITGHV